MKIIHHKIKVVSRPVFSDYSIIVDYYNVTFKNRIKHWKKIANWCNKNMSKKWFVSTSDMNFQYRYVIHTKDKAAIVGFKLEFL